MDSRLHGNPVRVRYYSIKYLKRYAIGFEMLVHATFTVGQNFTPNDPWPRVTVNRYSASLDHDSASMQQELVRD
jgi:hypothetical protein